MIDWSPPDRHEDWIVQINLLVSFLFPDDPLFPYETDSKEDVDCQVDHLRVDQRDRQVPVAGHLRQSLPEVGQSAQEVREARGVGDELLPFCRVENLYRPFYRDPPPTDTELVVSLTLTSP